MKRLKDYSLTNLLATLTEIKGEEVKNVKNDYSYNNYKIPSLKYYNICHKLPVFELEVNAKGLENLTIVGTSVVSKSAGSYGTENAWAGKLMVVSLESAAHYIENFTMEHSKSMTFYDNAYPTEDALKEIEIESERVFKKLVSSYKRRFGTPAAIERPKTLSESGYEIANNDIKKAEKLPEILPYKLSDIETSSKDIFYVEVYGNDSVNTKHIVELVIDDINKTLDADVVGMSRHNRDGEDWNSRIWAMNGMFKVYFVKR